MPNFFHSVSEVRICWAEHHSLLDWQDGALQYLGVVYNNFVKREISLEAL